MFRVCINNLRCMIGQKKDGVQYGGDVILKSISKHYKQQTYSNKITISNIDINKLRDYRNGYKTVKNNLNKGKLNINLGGDHSIAVSTIQPLLEKYKENLLVVIKTFSEMDICQSMAKYSIKFKFTYRARM